MYGETLVLFFLFECFSIFWLIFFCGPLVLNVFVVAVDFYIYFFCTNHKKKTTPSSESQLVSSRIYRKHSMLHLVLPGYHPTQISQARTCRSEHEGWACEAIGRKTKDKENTCWMSVLGSYLFHALLSPGTPKINQGCG